MILAWPLSIFAGLLGGWYLGYRARHDQEEIQKVNLPRDYLVGLNYLLNEEPDKAVDIFVKMLEVDSHTVETHLAVAKLFRRRGEVDRAIRIHQNLIARPQLEKIYREQSFFELGHDYLSAGVLDRAERIFLDLVDVKSFSASALRSLLDIYQQEKAWENAIQTAKKLEIVLKKSMETVIAHHYCELAEIAFTKGQNEQANRHLKEALETDKNCVRASLIQARLEMNQSDPKAALKSLKRIKNQNSDYLSEAIDPLASCYEAMGEEEKLVEYLLKMLEDHPRIPVVLILSERIRKWKGDKMAANFVADYVRRYPSISGLHLYVNLYLSNAEGQTKNDLIILQSLTKKLLADKPNYQCVTCGFSGKSLHWQCPSCKHWGSVKPIHSLEV
jgi:lipopolysaccharide biosynthesis regulator YciM